jgi:hypothetical protein
MKILRTSCCTSTRSAGAAKGSRILGPTTAAELPGEQGSQLLDRTHRIGAAACTRLFFVALIPARRGHVRVADRLGSAMAGARAH